jgi:hypothetical protein
MNGLGGHKRKRVFPYNLLACRVVIRITGKNIRTNGRSYFDRLALQHRRAGCLKPFFVLIWCRTRAFVPEPYGPQSSFASVAGPT